MKAVVLAAGQGTRLQPLTNQLPKPLVVVGQRTCLDIALESLSTVVDGVVVVTGYFSEKVRTHLEKHPPGLPFHLVVNSDPGKGNLTSLAATRSLIEDEGFILTNADHLLPADFYTRNFVAGEEIIVAAQNDRFIMNEEMKIALDESSHLKEISKTLATYEGAYIGTTRIPKNRSTAYWTAFDQVYKSVDPKRACVEGVLNELAGTETPPNIKWVNGVRWHEIDTWEDLDKARKELA